jgi:hypothetical protein
LIEEKKELVKKAEKFKFEEKYEESPSRRQSYKPLANDFTSLKPNKKLEMSTPRVQKIDSKLKDIEIPKIGKKVVEKKSEPKKVEPKGIVPSPLKPKTVVTVP